MRQKQQPMKYVALILVPLVVAMTGVGARAQADKEGFRYAQPKASSKVAKAAPLVKAPEAPYRLKSWEVNQSGESNVGLTPGVESIETRSDGTMRWKFYVLNRTESSIDFLFDMKNSYVADEEGETYEVVGREFANNQNQYHFRTLRPGARFKFYLDFTTPTRETKVFKVGILGELTTSFAKLKPFTVKLNKPIGTATRDEENNAEKPEAGDHPGEVGEFKVEDLTGAGAERPGGMTRVPKRSDLPAPKPSGEAAHAVLAAPREGRRYEGNIEAGAGGHAVGGILFERRSKDRLLAARIYSKTGPKKDIKLVGAICEDIAAPGGLVFRFEDWEEVEYLFSLDGNNLSGRDTRGNRYAFSYRK
jgi:hypothetical protein